MTDDDDAPLPTHSQEAMFHPRGKREPLEHSSQGNDRVGAVLGKPLGSNVVDGSEGIRQAP